MTIRDSEISMRRFRLAGLLAIGTALGGMAAWSTLFQVSGAVVAPGRVVVETDRQRIEHRDGGTVSQIFVHDGDKVKAGQPLILLETPEIDTELALNGTARDELMVLAARLKAERDGLGEIEFPSSLRERLDEPAIASLIANQRHLFATQRSSVEGRLAQLRERTKQLENETEGLGAQRSSAGQQLELAREELESQEELFGKGLTQVSRLLALKREIARLAGVEGQLVAEAARSQGKITETRLQMLQINDDYRTKALEELAETERKLAELAERQSGLVARIGRNTIVAPRDGYVQDMRIGTIGGVVRPGEAFMLIIPEHDGLAAEALISPNSIDQVSVGQKARLRFVNAHMRSTPEVEGIVETVSADVTATEKDSEAHYRVRISVPADEQAKLGELVLKPGMQIEAFILTSERTPLSYLLKPLTDQWARAMRES